MSALPTNGACWGGPQDGKVLLAFPEGTGHLNGLGWPALIHPDLTPLTDAGITGPHYVAVGRSRLARHVAVYIWSPLLEHFYETGSHFLIAEGES